MFESGVYTSFHGQIVPFYNQIVPQFQCRTRCEAPFLLACKLKERGKHISNFLVLLVALKLVKSSDYIVERSGLERSDWIANLQNCFSHLDLECKQRQLSERLSRNGALERTLAGATGI